MRAVSIHFEYEELFTSDSILVEMPRSMKLMIWSAKMTREETTREEGNNWHKHRRKSIQSNCMRVKPFQKWATNMETIWVREIARSSVIVPSLWYSISVVHVGNQTNSNCTLNVECLPCDPLRDLQNDRRNMAKRIHKLVSIRSKRRQLDPLHWQPTSTKWIKLDWALMTSSKTKEIIYMVYLIQGDAQHKGVWWKDDKNRCTIYGGNSFKNAKKWKFPSVKLCAHSILSKLTHRFSHGFECLFGFVS